MGIIQDKALEALSEMRSQDFQGCFKNNDTFRRPVFRLLEVLSRLEGTSYSFRRIRGKDYDEIVLFFGIEADSGERYEFNCNRFIPSNITAMARKRLFRDFITQILGFYGRN